jgi:hypothetical protein
MGDWGSTAGVSAFAPSEAEELVLTSDCVEPAAALSDAVASAEPDSAPPLIDEVTSAESDGAPPLIDVAAAAEPDNAPPAPSFAEVPVASEGIGVPASAPVVSSPFPVSSPQLSVSCELPGNW